MHLPQEQAYDVARSLADLLDIHRYARAAWREQQRRQLGEDPRGLTEQLHRRFQARWSIAITHPEPPPGGLDCCAASVLARDRRDRSGALEYRGCCLGCGWVASRWHPRSTGADEHCRCALTGGPENAAVEDAHDHSHPAWRNLPVLPTGYVTCSSHHKGPDEQAVRGLLALSPAGWPERLGPVLTHRG